MIVDKNTPTLNVKTEKTENLKKMLDTCTILVKEYKNRLGDIYVYANDPDKKYENKTIKNLNFYTNMVSTIEAELSTRVVEPPRKRWF